MAFSLVLLLLIFLLEGPLFAACVGHWSCAQGFVGSTTSDHQHVNCPQNHYQHSAACAQLIVINPDGGAKTLFLVDCNEAGEEELHCLLTKSGGRITNKGNCFTGKYGDFEKFRQECNIGPKTPVPDPKPQDDDIFTLCNCNHETKCNDPSSFDNPHCECVDTETMCGEKACEKRPNAYQCHCEGVPSHKEAASLAKCVKGKRYCAKEKAGKMGCFSYAAKEEDILRVYKDCASVFEYGWIGAALNSLARKGECGSGPAGVYAKALHKSRTGNDWKPGDGDIDGVLKVGDKARVNVCRCDGNLCNADPITVTDDKGGKNKNGGGRIGGQGRGALGAVVVVVVLVAAHNWK